MMGLRRARRRQLPARGPLVRGRASTRARIAAGATFLYFGLIGLPALFFGSAMAVDFTRIIVAAREMHNAAEASALAGAYQFSTVGDPTTLDPAQAKSAAQDTLCTAARAGQLHLTTFTCADAQSMTPRLSADRTTVTVTVNYAVDGLIFVDTLSSMFGDDRGDTLGGYQVSAKAFVCNPAAANGPTQGYCVRPTAWR